MKGKKELWELFKRRYGKVWHVGNYKRDDGILLPVLSSGPIDMDRYWNAFCGEFSPEGILLSGSSRYLEDSELFVNKGEFRAFGELAGCWRRDSKGWAGYIATGNAWCGHIGYFYCPPDSEKGEDKPKDFSLKRHSVPCTEKNGNISVISRNYINDGLSGLTVHAGNFKAEMERFDLCIYKGRSREPFTLWHKDIGCLEEFIRLYPEIAGEFWNKAQ